jgi:4-amino-4-deoxy-L-arabinose transferase-like glycosyltransferase
MSGHARSKGSIPEWAWIALLLTLVLDVWWRGHTFGPSVRDRLNGFAPWPVVGREAEPLDCDEAAYAYMGRRMARGDVLYRDLVENKPPLGYWIYAAAVALGGADEWTVRLMPLPIVLATIALVWGIGLDVAGPGAGCITAFLYAILSTDPYLYGNGSQLELAINLLSVASLWALIRAWRHPGWLWPIVAGACVAGAGLIRQSAGILLPMYLGVLLLLGRRRDAAAPKASRPRWVPILGTIAGFALVLGIAAAVLVAQGAAADAWECVVVAGASLVADTPNPRNAPPLLTRWVTGNSDPRDGSLPWPFGQTDWLVWWGAGSWPLWLAGAVGVLAMLGRRADGARRIVAVWMIAAWVQVALPRQFWAHYYLLPTPGVALAVGVLIVDALDRIRGDASSGRRHRALAGFLVAGLGIAAILGTVSLQVRDYLLVPSEELTVRYKGGRQWVRLRQIGRELAIRGRVWATPRLFVWGWQSPLYIYSGMDSPSRHFFVNDLMKAYADRPHPLVSQWVAEIERDLREKRPELIFTGDPPFRGLRALLAERYGLSRVVPEAPVLWVEAGRLRAFESFRSARSPVAPEPTRPITGLWTWLPGVRRRMPQSTPGPAGGPGGGGGPPRVPLDIERRR